MDKAIKIINELKKNGIIKEYAIGGGIATILYTEPLLTYDLDIFYIPTEEREKIVSLSPIYNFLAKKGYKPNKEQVMIEGMPVQFLPPYNELIREAIEQAVTVKYKNEPARFFRVEYLIAIMTQTFRPKDRERLVRVLAEAKIDKKLLNKILKKHGLADKFQHFLRGSHEK
ncbi:MAG: hypothetical protein WCT39_03820 [Candidatus Margulisiibacteriota bacterium]